MLPEMQSPALCQRLP